MDGEIGLAQYVQIEVIRLLGVMNTVQENFLVYDLSLFV